MLQVEKEKKFWEFIDILYSCDLLENVVVVGSWAEMLYEEYYDKKYSITEMTNDIDILYININYKNNSNINFNEKMKLMGCYIERDRLTDVTRYVNKDFEIEFLSHLKGSGSSSVNYLKSIGIKSEALRHLDILEKFSFKIKKNWYEVRVPEPSAYVIHKLIINHNRRPIEKRYKDISKIKILLIHIKNDAKQKKRFKEIYDCVCVKSKRCKKYIEDCCEINCIDISELINEDKF